MKEVTTSVREMRGLGGEPSGDQLSGQGINPFAINRRRVNPRLPAGKLGAIGGLKNSGLFCNRDPGKEYAAFCERCIGTEEKKGEPEDTSLDPTDFRKRALPFWNRKKEGYGQLAGCCKNKVHFVARYQGHSRRVMKVNGREETGSRLRETHFSTFRGSEGFSGRVWQRPKGPTG